MSKLIWGYFVPSCLNNLVLALRANLPSVFCACLLWNSAFSSPIKLRSVGSNWNVTLFSFKIFAWLFSTAHNSNIWSNDLCILVILIFFFTYCIFPRIIRYKNHLRQSGDFLLSKLFSIQMAKKTWLFVKAESQTQQKLSPFSGHFCTKTVK